MDGKDSFIGRLLGSAEKFTTEQVTQTVQLLLEHGARWQASDIHIEPHDDYVLVRYRIDGSLHSAHKIPRKALDAIIAQFKSLAALDNTETATPQQGTFQTTIHDQIFDVHISSMPVYGGEKIVLHLAAQARAPLSIKQLGFWGKNLSAIQTTLGRNHGMIIVSAPKHHGRPTTQASMVAALNNPSLNIATIEESIEYRIPHASQSAVNHRTGLTMFKGLQAALHQDPNVLLIGHLADKATAELAIQSSSTGHLIVAGMHSDSAAAALLRLRALEIPTYLIATSTQVVTAQRLVRKLCEHCRERLPLQNDQLGQLQQAFGIVTAASFKRIHELEAEAIELGMGNDDRPSTTLKTITHVWQAHSEGCEACNHTGYKGRVALTEVLSMTDNIQKALLDPEVTSNVLQTRAIKEDGFVPLALDGIIKALRGRASIQDVLHAVSTLPLK